MPPEKKSWFNLSCLWGPYVFLKTFFQLHFTAQGPHLISPASQVQLDLIAFSALFTGDKEDTEGKYHELGVGLSGLQSLTPIIVLRRS